MKNAQYWIDRLSLQPHPEGGYFREIYRSSETVDRSALPSRFPGARAFSTSIYFLLKSDQVSTLHRIQSDEIWHFYSGSSLRLHIICADGHLETLKLGPDPDQGESFQLMVPAGCWFGADLDAADSYTLVGCTVAPGFDFADFTLAKQHELLTLYPQSAEMIIRLTRKDNVEHS
jgi:uncharacterized protein